MNGFTYRYAIRMPNGQLFKSPQQQQTEELRDQNQQLYMRMLGIYVSEPDPTPPPDPCPMIFDKREDAEQVFNNLRESARQFGVDNWGGTIVAQLCTPFTPGDPGMEFADAVIYWLTANEVQP